MLFNLDFESLKTKEKIYKSGRFTLKIITSKVSELIDYLSDKYESMEQFKSDGKVELAEEVEMEIKEDEKYILEDCGRTLELYRHKKMIEQITLVDSNERSAVETFLTTVPERVLPEKNYQEIIKALKKEEEINDC